MLIGHETCQLFNRSVYFNLPIHCVSGHGEGMVAANQAQQQLMEGVGVDSGAGVEMMVMDSLDPTLLQMKTEVSSAFTASSLTSLPHKKVPQVLMSS